MAKKIAVTKWQAEDGTLHDTEIQADDHDALEAIGKLVSEFSYRGMDEKDVVDGIWDHRAKLKAILVLCP